MFTAPLLPQSSSRRSWAPLAALGLMLAATAAAAAEQTVRLATFNIALYGTRAGEIRERLHGGGDRQAQALAEIIQRVRPDVLVLNEIDYDEAGATLAAFAEEYLAVAQNVSGVAPPPEPLKYPHRIVFPANTGEHSGFDLDRNGRVDPADGGRDYGGDCWGYGVYPGQYAFALLSQFPLDEGAIRQFRRFLWRDMPGALLPDDPATPDSGDWYSPEILAQFRLSSKNHCDVPVLIHGRRVHLLLSHPTPPVFDGPEDRNGRRNHDELRFWRDYVGEAAGAAYIVDDAGRQGGLADDDGAPATFVILGDLNGDPHDGEGSAGIRQVLTAPRVLRYDPPRSLGGVAAAQRQGGANASHRGDPAEDTCDAADDPAPGNLRLDYVLPSADLSVAAAGVFWPDPADPLAPLTAGTRNPVSSDHRLVWIDVPL